MRYCADLAVIGRVAGIIKSKNHQLPCQAKALDSLGKGALS